MRKILVVDNSLDITGAFKAILINALELRNEFEFHFLIPSKSKNKARIEADGFKCLQLNMLEISKRPGNLILYVPYLIYNSIILSRYVGQHKIDVIHVNDIYNLLGLLTKCWYKIDVITHIRRMPESFPSLIYSCWVKLHKKFATKIIAVSEANARIFQSSKKIEVVYDSVPLHERFPPYSCEKVDVIRILYLANYNRGKGQDHAIRIAKNLLNKNVNNFMLHFYGGDFGMQKNRDFKDELIKQTVEKGLSNHVFFHNKTETVEKVMKEHDVILNLSDSESFSNVSLEALFYGVPLVATDVGGTSEMFENEKSGLLVKKGNVEEMLHATNKLIDSFDSRCKLSKASKVYVRDKFDLKNTSLKLSEIYNGI